MTPQALLRYDLATILPDRFCLHELFEQQVVHFPDTLAVVYEDAHLTYEELNAEANQLAHLLRELGVGRETPVGIFMERSGEMVVAILAVLKAGGAYVPLDPTYPLNRLAYMLKDAGMPILLTQSHIASRLPEHKVTRVHLDSEQGRISRQATTSPNNLTKPDCLAYIIYTSGSTGMPKGAGCLHSSVINFLADWEKRQPIRMGDHVSCWTSLSFDVSVYEIFSALLAGGTLYVVPDHIRPTPPTFIDWLYRNGIHSAYVPAYMLADLAASLEQRKDRLPLRRLKVGVEPINELLLARIAAQIPDLHIVNCYGPTETTIGTLLYSFQPDKAQNRNVPIGRPVQNTYAYLLDDDMQPVADGEIGELYIGGVGVGRGYVNHPDLTAARFIPDPFRPGTRIYRTGDLARYLPDGNVEFIGRIDQQVKFRGLRIELGEIEARLRGHPSIQEAVVLLRHDVPGQKQLVAYVRPETQPEVSSLQLRQFLRNDLPTNMIPSVFVTLAEFPLTPSGKIDRRALPAPDLDVQSVPSEKVAPRDALEEMLAEAWKETLDLPDVDIHADFFDLGGTSILAAILFAGIEERLGEVTHFVALLDHPTIAGLAQYFRDHYPEAVAPILGHDGSPPAADQPQVDDNMVEHVRQLVRASQPYKPIPPAAAKNPTAVFILCPPRSGSTLLRVMLGGHPSLFAPPEMDLLSFADLGERRQALDGRFAFLREGLLRALVQVKETAVEEAQEIVAQFEEQRLPTQEFYRLLQNWIAPRILVDKSTAYATDLKVLQRVEEWFESPRYIHLVRHPYGMIRSYARIHMDQLCVRYEHPYSTRRLAELIWLVSQQNIHAFLASVPADRQLQVHFEDLVADPQQTIARVSTFLGLDDHPAMLQPYQDPEGRMTDGLYPESRTIGDLTFHEHRGIEPAVAGRWKTTYRGDFLGEVTWKMAETLGYPRVVPDWSVLVPIQPAGSRPPFFCIHGFGGGVADYAELARLLGPDQPFFGIQARGLDGQGEPASTVEEMATDYVRAIQSLQPEGPYHLGGYCLGGVVAFEMARQLEEQGERVATLAILEGLAITRREAWRHLWKPRAMLNSLRNLPLWIREHYSVLGQDGWLLPAIRRNLPRTYDGALHEAGAGDMEAVLRGTACEQPQWPAHVRELAWHHYRALQNYRPQPYAGRAALFRVQTLPLLRASDPFMGWKKVIQGGLDVYRISGQHDTILKPPYVMELAAELQDCLAKASSTSSPPADAVLPSA